MESRPATPALARGAERNPPRPRRRTALRIAIVDGGLRLSCDEGTAVDEQFAEVGEHVTLCYEQFGPVSGAPMLLIMGLGTQMIGWPEGFCELLVDRGYSVTRFDNRDIGRSTKFRKVRPPRLLDLLTRSRSAAGYLLSDMANDAVGLLDVLGIERAHVVGASMGGMIAQTMAIERPDRVMSLASIMSTTGHRLRGQPALSIYPLLIPRRATNAEIAAERMVQTFTAIGSPGFDRDEAELRRMIKLSMQRSGGGDQAGTARQLQAILASGDRTSALRRVSVPTVVIHGSADRLVRPSGGAATARAIPGAELVRIKGMGHDLPRGAWPQMVEAIDDNAQRVPATVAESA